MTVLVFIIASGIPIGLWLGWKWARRDRERGPSQQQALGVGRAAVRGSTRSTRDVPVARNSAIGTALGRDASRRLACGSPFSGHLAHIWPEHCGRYRVRDSRYSDLGF